MKSFAHITLAGFLTLTLFACPQPQPQPPATVTVSAASNAYGTISPSSRVVKSGETTTFTITPNAQYLPTVTGCGGSLSGNTYTTGTITAACSVNATFNVPAGTTGNTSFDVTGNGVQQVGRTSKYKVSGLSAPAAGRPLVIYLHGDGGNNINVPSAYSEWSDHQAAVIVAPQGLGGTATWNFRMDGRNPNSTLDVKPPLGIDDVAFIKEIITRGTNAMIPLFGAGNVIDPTKVFVVGESRGAGMAYVLYAHPDTKNLITAIAPISGTFFCSTLRPGRGIPSPTNPVPVYVLSQDSDEVCGEDGTFGYFTPKSNLYVRTNPPRIFDVHATDDFPSTAAPALDDEFGNLILMTKQWAKTSNNCLEPLPSANPVFANATINGKTVSAYRQRNTGNTAACAADVTFFIVQGGGHVPGGYAERVVKWFFGQYNTATNTFN